MIQDYLPKDEDGLVSEINLRRFTNKISIAFSLAMRKTILHNDIGFLKQNGYIPVDLLKIGKARINKLAKKLLLTRFAKIHNMTLKEMTEAQKRVALKQIPSFHSLRHSVCTELVREKGIAFTRAFIGHSTIKTTEEYKYISQLEVSKKYFERN